MSSGGGEGGLRQVELIWPLGAQLGEGPLWAEDDRALWFTDIEGRSVHRLAMGTDGLPDPADDARQSWRVEGRPGFVVRDERGGILVGAERQVRRFADGALGAVVVEVDTPPGTRLNDATVGPDGRLWFGSMDETGREAKGQVHLFHGAAPASDAGAHAAITNGPAVSADGRTLYHVDTRERRIWAFPIEGRDRLADGRLFAEIERGAGTPDGVVLDAEGCLWVALWGGWGVRRYDEHGRIMQFVRLPVAQVTKIAFGGPDLRTAYATSARTGLDSAALAAEPDAGGLFAFEAPAPGLPANRLRLA